MKVILFGLILFASGTTVFALENAQGKVTYKSSKDIDFEKLLIQGQMKRPDLIVVTGSTDQDQDGLLRLRENFTDRMAQSAGEANE